MKRYFYFLMAGSVGFGVDVGVLMLLVHVAHFDAYSARFIAIGCALCCTWLINRTVTFDGSVRSLTGEGMRYWSVGVTSGLVNSAVYSAMLLFDRDIPPFVALVVSSGCAQIVSYNGYSRFVFQAEQKGG